MEENQVFKTITQTTTTPIEEHQVFKTIHQTSIHRANSLELPYEKFYNRGAGALTDLELLAIFIQTGVKGKDVLTLAEEVLERTSRFGKGIAGLHALSVEELCDISGIGRVKAIKLKAICELAKRMAASGKAEQISMNSPETIADYFMEEMCYEQVEQVRILLFDNKMHYIANKVITIGTANSSLISSREIFRWALDRHGVFFVLMHNHPSGDPNPSREDTVITEKLYEAGKLIGIELADHIIIGNHCYYSYRQMHESPFS